MEPTLKPSFRIPSFVYVILIPLGIIALIGSIILLFTVLANVEGVASAIMLIAGYGAFRLTRTDEPTPGNMGSFLLAGGIVFFALMGVAIDQPGNFIYNKPLDYFCEQGSRMNRTVEILHPLPGRTDMIQNFQCMDAEGNITGGVTIPQLIGVRFAEYVLIGYVLYFLSRIRRKSKTQLH